MASRYIKNCPLTVSLQDLIDKIDKNDYYTSMHSILLLDTPKVVCICDV